VAQLFSLGSKRAMKRAMFIFCGVTWFVFGLFVGIISLRYLVGGGSAFYVRHQDWFKILQSWLVWRRFEQFYSDEQVIGS
jgi:hypothetical protein